MRGVILAGGEGVRMKDIGLVTNKHLLPVFDMPMIYYPIQSFVDAGIKDICIVVGNKSCGEILRLVGDGRHLGLDHVYYVYQHKSGGIAQALSLVEEFAHSEDISVILGDNIFTSSIKSIVDEYRSEPPDFAKIVLKEVPNPCAFGVVEFMEDNGKSIKQIIEKPKNPPSSFCVVGLYFYPPSVFSIIETLKPSARNELEVTDINNFYASEKKLNYSIYSDTWFDAGSIEDITKASQYFSVKDKTRLS